MRTLILISLIFLCKSATAAIVKGVKSNRRLHVSLELEEKGLFEEGNTIHGHVPHWNSYFRAKIIKRKKNGDLILKIRKGDRLPQKRMSVSLEPTYREGWQDGGRYWRKSSGENQFGEKFYLGLEVGNGNLAQMIHAGMRLGTYLSKESSISFHLSQGSQSGELAAASGFMTSVRWNEFWGKSFHTSLGLGLKRTTVTPVISKQLSEDAKSSGRRGSSSGQASNNITNEEIEKIKTYANVSEDYFVEIGIGNKFAFNTTQLGNSFIVGFDWLVYHAVVDYRERSPEFEEYLEKKISLKQEGGLYHRVYLGFSF